MKFPPACATYLAIKSFLILICDSHHPQKKELLLIWSLGSDFFLFVGASVVALRARVRPAQHVKYPRWFSDANWPNSIWCWSSHRATLVSLFLWCPIGGFPAHFNVRYVAIAHPKNQIVLERKQSGTLPRDLCWDPSAHKQRWFGRESNLRRCFVDKHDCRFDFYRTVVRPSKRCICILLSIPGKMPSRSDKTRSTLVNVLKDQACFDETPAPVWRFSLVGEWQMAQQRWTRQRWTRRRASDVIRRRSNVPLPASLIQFGADYSTF